MLSLENIHAYNDYSHILQGVSLSIGEREVVTSSFRDMHSEDLRPLVDRYFRGSTSSVYNRIKLFKMLWDALGSEFGSRHTLYQCNYGGRPELVRLNILQFAKERGRLNEMKHFMEVYMSE